MDESINKKHSCSVVALVELLKNINVAYFIEGISAKSITEVISIIDTTVIKAIKGEEILDRYVDIYSSKIDKILSINRELIRNAIMNDICLDSYQFMGEYISILSNFNSIREVKNVDVGKDIVCLINLLELKQSNLELLNTTMALGTRLKTTLVHSDTSIQCARHYLQEIKHTLKE